MVYKKCYNTAYNRSKRLLMQQKNMTQTVKVESNDCA